MKFTWINEANGNGPVTGLSRNAEAGETSGNAPNTDFVWGYDSRFYDVVSWDLTPKSEAEVDSIKGEDQALSTADAVYSESLQEPLMVTISNVDYWFTRGWEASQLIDSRITLADYENNNNDIVLWDHFNIAQSFKKNDAYKVAAAVSGEYHRGYDEWMAERQAIEGE